MIQSEQVHDAGARIFKPDLNFEKIEPKATKTLEQGFINVAALRIAILFFWGFPWLFFGTIIVSPQRHMEPRNRPNIPRPNVYIPSKISPAGPRT